MFALYARTFGAGAEAPPVTVTPELGTDAPVTTVAVVWNGRCAPGAPISA
jgi:hypothetical protein